MSTIEISLHAHSEAYAQLCHWAGQSEGYWIEDGPYLVAKIACERADRRLDPAPVAVITTSPQVWKVILEGLHAALELAEENEYQPTIDACEQAIQHINNQLTKKN